MRSRNTYRPSDVRDTARSSDEEPEETRIGFFAVDGAIPLNFYPPPTSEDPEPPATDGDIALERAMTSAATLLRRSQRKLNRGVAVARAIVRPRTKTEEASVS